MMSDSTPPENSIIEEAADTPTGPGGMTERDAHYNTLKLGLLGLLAQRPKFAEQMCLSYQAGLYHGKKEFDDIEEGLRDDCDCWLVAISGRQAVAKLEDILANLAKNSTNGQLCARPTPNTVKKLIKYANMQFRKSTQTDKKKAREESMVHMSGIGSPESPVFTPTAAAG